MFRTPTRRRPSRSLPCRPEVEALECRWVPARLPVLVVPGQPASLPTSLTSAPDPIGQVAAFEDFALNLGTPPTELTATFEFDFLGQHVRSPYKSLVEALTGAGYHEGVDLFVAAHDWRMPVAKLDGVDDGVLTEVTAGLITDNRFEYGVDYLGYWLTQVTQAWEAANPGQALERVDVISHSEGHLITRAYIDSLAYGGAYTDAGGQTRQLPTFNHFISLAGPNEGASVVFNPLTNNWNNPIGIPMSQGGMFDLMEFTYAQVVDLGVAVNGPDGTPFITLDTIRDPLSGQPDPLRFIQQYLPSLRDEMATYPFLDGHDVNNDPNFRNNLLLDINGGGDPNAFAGAVGHFTAVYATRRPTFTTVRTKVGRGGKVLPLDANPLTGSRRTQPGERWFQDRVLLLNGDGLVPIRSAVSTFADDPRITLLPQNRFVLDHNKMVADRRVLKIVIGILKT